MIRPLQVEGPDVIAPHSRGWWISRTISPWWTVAAGTLGNALGAASLILYCYSIIAIAMSQDYQWDRTVAAANVTAFFIGSGCGAVMLGWLIGRLGIRAPTAVFIVAFGSLFALTAALPPEPMLHHLVFFLVGVTGAACTSMPYAVAISGFFDDRRGLALGIVLAGGGLGATLLPQLVQYLVTEVGWRAAFLMIGGLAALLPALGLILLVRTPPSVVQRSAAARTGEHPAPIRELLADRHFILIAASVLLVSLAAIGCTTALVALFSDRQYSAATIATIMSTVGLSSWVSRLLVGYLLDRIFAPYLCAVIFSLAALAPVILISSATPFAAFLGAILIGLMLGAEGDIVSFLISRYFRLIDFSRLLGIVWVVWAWGNGIGTAFASWIFKVTGSYATAFLLFGGAILISAVMICLLGTYRYQEAPAPPEHTGERFDHGI